MDSYPPGFDPKELNNPYREALQKITDAATIRYNLTVEVNEEVVYEDYFYSEESMLQNLHKADLCIEEYFDEEAERMLDNEED